MAQHFIAMNGSYGCLPDNTVVFDRAGAAVDYLTDLFELDNVQETVLRGAHYINLPVGAGADYAEITKCECKDPSIHEDN